MNILKNYGERVEGYNQGVLNDREVRAAAGIMFMLGMIVIFVGIGFNHTIVARVYLALVWADLTIRIINPKYSPFMLLGRVFVQNQTPEYVGAVQKRFAWILGWIIFLPMINWFVLHWDINFYRVLLCVLCLTIIFLESAFGICIGCMLYELFTRNKAQHCPGGVCEIREKDPIQTFSPIQKIITFFMIVGLLVGTYLFITKTKSETFFGEFLYELFLTKQELEKIEQQKFEEEAAREFADDEDDDF